MPHICTRCNNIFDSGEDILKGCPVCGWKKFMFVKKNAVQHAAQQQSEQIITQSMGVKKPPKGRVKGQAKETQAQAPGEVPKEPMPNLPSLKHQAKQPAQPATAAHAEARPASNADPYVTKTETVVADPLKPEENKLESIKITAPGTYELNLPSLFEREELIMAVKEGTYFIDLSSAFRKGKKE